MKLFIVKIFIVKIVIVEEQEEQELTCDLLQIQDTATYWSMLLYATVL